MFHNSALPGQLELQAQILAAVIPECPPAEVFEDGAITASAPAPSGEEDG